MEQDVYVCTWKRTPDEFILWVKSRPQLRGTGPSYADAEQHLIDAILRLGQTAIPVLEFDPPLPKSDLDSRYADPELYLVCGDDRFEADGPRRTPDETIEERESRFRAWDDYFRSPLCRECSATSSPRSNRPLSLEYAPSRIDGAFGMVGPEGAAPCARVFSGEFLNLLSAEEKRSLEFRPVIWKSRRRQFHELIGPEGPPFVAVAALPVRGWRCWLCGHRTWGYYVESMNIHEFVAKSDLPNPLPSLFTVGHWPDLHLCATAERWSQLVGRKGTRGFTSHLLGVVGDDQVIRSPELPTQAQAQLKLGFDRV